MDRFDLLGPLPVENSTTVLEASAGTGKTFALAGLVTRYVAEGAATLDQMLLITFGRAASQELRERVRDQIVHALKAFDDASLVGEGKHLKLKLKAGPVSWPAICFRYEGETPQPGDHIDAVFSFSSDRFGPSGNGGALQLTVVDLAPSL